MHLVGFTIEIYYDARSDKRQTVDKFGTARTRGMYLMATRITKTLLSSISWLHNVHYKHKEPRLTQFSCNYCNHYHRPLANLLSFVTRLLNTLRTGDADLRFYVATVQDG